MGFVLAIHVSNQVMIPFGSVGTEIATETFRCSMNFLVMPPEVLPRTEGFLTHHAVIPLACLEMSRPEKNNTV